MKRKFFFIVFFQIRSRGGECVPVQVDHEKVDEVEALFDRINKEQNGRLDILVNNAYKGVEVEKMKKKKHFFKDLSFIFIQRLLSIRGKKFWEVEPDIFDEINNVGLRFDQNKFFYVFFL